MVWTPVQENRHRFLVGIQLVTPDINSSYYIGISDNTEEEYGISSILSKIPVWMQRIFGDCVVKCLHY